MVLYQLSRSSVRAQAQPRSRDHQSTNRPIRTAASTPPLARLSQALQAKKCSSRGSTRHGNLFAALTSTFALCRQARMPTSYTVETRNSRVLIRSKVGLVEVEEDAISAL